MEIPAVERAVAVHDHGPHVPFKILGMRAVDLRRLDGHGAVHVRRQGGDAARLLQPGQVEHQLLRAPDRERGDDDRPAPFHGSGDDALELRGNGLRIVTPVPVGGLHNHLVGLPERRRIREDRGSEAAQIAGEDQPPAVRSLADLDRDDGRAQDVPGPLEPDSDPGPEVDRLPVAHPLDLLRGLEPLLGGIER